ncbi:MAG: hypothetical protein ACI9QL_005327, partial [Candidatus Omnitrophota bacterium]
MAKSRADEPAVLRLLVQASLALQADEQKG